MLDYLTGLGWDPIGEEHLELHHQVAALGGALGVGQTLTLQPADSTRFDDITAWQQHHSVVEGGDINCASTQSLEKRREEKISSPDRLWVFTKKIVS